MKNTSLLLLSCGIFLVSIWISPDLLAGSLRSTRYYSINLLWVNNKFEVGHRFLSRKAKDEASFVNEYLLPVCNWAKLNPSAKVNLWFDRVMTSPEAIKNTTDLFNQICSQEFHRNIELMDVRNLPLVRDNPEVFVDKFPVYFRADLLRLVATIDKTVTPDRYFVYADFDITPMNEQDLFDTDTVENLSDYGFVFAYAGRSYENSFHMVDRESSNIMVAIEKILVSGPIEYMLGHVRGKTPGIDRPYGQEIYTIPGIDILELPQYVFSKYNEMLKVYYYLRQRNPSNALDNANKIIAELMRDKSTIDHLQFRYKKKHLGLAALATLAAVSTESLSCKIPYAYEGNYIQDILKIQENVLVKFTEQNMSDRYFLTGSYRSLRPLKLREIVVSGKEKQLAELFAINDGKQRLLTIRDNRDLICETINCGLFLDNASPVKMVEKPPIVINYMSRGSY
ncbi:MAG: hypothetical protein HQK53_17740 [Oligoflexia bacterium]|nr:hypothetical protein [Oligoflexia bacterium]